MLSPSMSRLHGSPIDWRVRISALSHQPCSSFWMHSVRPLKSKDNKWTTERTLVCGNQTCRRYTLLHLQIITGALLSPAVKEIVWKTWMTCEIAFLDVRLLQKEECTKLFHFLLMHWWSSSVGSLSIYSIFTIALSLLLACQSSRLPAWM